jgi:hypothetical protein
MTGSVVSSNGELLPYSEITDSTYANLAAQNFALDELEPGILILRGNCPRCGALIEVPAVSGIFQGLRSITDIFRRRPTTSPGAAHLEPMICVCEEEHPNRPKGRVGCGAYWTLILQVSPR